MKIPPLALLALCAALAAVLAHVFPILRFDAPGWLVFLVAVAGALFMLPAVTSFVKHKTTVSPMAPGDATTLVRSGIYAITRNPMYVGMLTMLLAAVLHLGTLSGFLAVALFYILIDRYQIRLEEQQLLKIFGSAYRDYAQCVPRWLVLGRGLEKDA